MGKKKKLTISLNEEEAENLLHLVYAGGWMIWSHEKDDPFDFPEKETEQVIYRAAHEIGMEETIIYDKELDHYFLSQELDEELHEDVVVEYDENAFVEKLSQYLTYRSMVQDEKLHEKLESEPEEKLIWSINTHMKFSNAINMDFEKLIEHIGKFFDEKQDL